MQKAQVFLRDDQKKELKALAARTGQRQSELIRQGVDLVIEQERRKEGDWKSAFHAVCGIWKDRDELEKWFQGIRADLDARNQKRFADEA